MGADREPGLPGTRRGGRLEAGAALLLAVLLSSGLVGCPADRGETAVPSDSTYVELMARLSLIERALSREPERADSARRATLEERGVSAEALRRYARRHGDDPEHMLAIWRAIEVKVGTLQQSEEAAERELRPPAPAPPETDDPAREEGEPVEADPSRPGATER